MQYSKHSMTDSTPQRATPVPAGEFKPNIYPVMYWALAFGVAAGILLLVVQLLSRFITVLWFPVFLAGLLYGGWRNYKKQKAAWSAATGSTPSAGTAWDEFKQAAGDIASASQDLMKEEAPVEEPTPTSAPSDQPETPADQGQQKSPPSNQ